MQVCINDLIPLRNHIYIFIIVRTYDYFFVRERDDINLGLAWTRDTSPLVMAWVSFEKPDKVYEAK